MQTPLCAQRVFSPTFQKSPQPESPACRSHGRAVNYFDSQNSLNGDGCSLGCFPSRADSQALFGTSSGKLFFLFTCHPSLLCHPQVTPCCPLQQTPAGLLASSDRHVLYTSSAPDTYTYIHSMSHKHPQTIFTDTHINSHLAVPGAPSSLGI